jgi:hypothetical protein
MTELTPQLTPGGRRRRSRLVIAAVSLVAAATASVPLATNGHRAQASTGELTAMRQTHHLQSAGYVATACTRDGTLMVNPKTHRHVIVKLA